MGRYIKLDINNRVSQIRKGEIIAQGEIESSTGELGQIMQADGSFINDSTPSPVESPTIEERLTAIEDALLMII
jgi:hypothetical protein